MSTRFDQTAILEVSEGWRQWPQLVAQVDAYRLIAGHVGFGFEHAFQRQPAVVTFLRDPIERAVSAYYYLRQIDDSYYATRFQHAERRKREQTARLAKDLSLLDFIRSEPQTAAVHLGNVQTWYLSSSEIRRRPYSELRAVDLKIAEENLERCICFGLVERPGESMAMLSHTLGWEAFADLPNANSTRDRPSVKDLGSPTIDSLLQLTQLDRELYRFAEQLWERRWRAMLAEPSTQNPRDALGTPRSILAKESSDNVVFTFDRAIPGNGWYGAERFANRWCSWTGPGREAWITLQVVPRQEAVLRVHIAHALKPEILHRTQLLVNDILLVTQVRHDTDGHILEAPVPMNLITNSGGVTRIMIRVPEVFRPCDLDPANADSRRLGVAVACVALDWAA